MYCATAAGSCFCCGNTEPGTAATASSMSRNSATRIEVSWRHAKRSIPTAPSLGTVGPGLVVEVSAAPLNSSAMPSGRYEPPAVVPLVSSAIRPESPSR